MTQMKMEEKKADYSEDSDSFEIVENEKKKTDSKVAPSAKTVGKETKSWTDYIKKHQYVFGLFIVIALLLIIIVQIQFKYSDLQEEQRNNLEMMKKVQEESQRLLDEMKEMKIAERTNLNDLLKDELVTPIPADEDISSSTTESSTEKVPRPPLTFNQLLPVYIAMIILTILTYRITKRAHQE